MGTLEQAEHEGAAQSEPSIPNGNGLTLKRGILIAAIVAVAAAAVGAALLPWQRQEQDRTLCMTRMRRVSMALQLYSQDWDGRLMPPTERLPDGSWRTWPEVLHPYVGAWSLMSDPSNPVPDEAGKLRHPTDGYEVRTAFALNRRFWNTFGPGPFPMDNLELPNLTVMLVTSGPMWRDPTHPPQRPAAVGLLDYGDTTDRIDGLVPYPSAHDRKLAVCSVDGHAATLRVEHYSPSDSRHDRMFGRINGNLYNWNGGRPNGETDRPARE